MRNQTIAHVSSHVDMYSSSTEEFATIVGFLQIQEIFVDPIFIK
jgi:hypothetical protein